MARRAKRHCGIRQYIYIIARISSYIVPLYLQTHPLRFHFLESRGTIDNRRYTQTGNNQARHCCAKDFPLQQKGAGWMEASERQPLPTQTHIASVDRNINIFSPGRTAIGRAWQANRRPNDIVIQYETFGLIFIHICITGRTATPAGAMPRRQYYCRRLRSLIDRCRRRSCWSNGLLHLLLPMLLSMESGIARIQLLLLHVNGCSLSTSAR